MYSPSYVSLESGFAFYNLIPEGVFTTTSVTTKNTANYNTRIGNFDFRHIKEDLFFGYRLVQEQGFTFKIAEAEKVVLDFFYLNTINFIEEMEELRLNEIQAKEVINFEKLDKYLRIYDSMVLNKRLQQFKKAINPITRKNCKMYERFIIREYLQYKILEIIFESSLKTN